MSLPSPIVLDNTVLTNFALTESTELVFQLWADRICTTPAVMAEHRAGVDDGSLPRGWTELDVIELTSEEQAMLGRLPRGMGAGEKSCIAVASCRGGSMISDDLDARNTAADLGVQISGTIGILIACVRREILDLETANELLSDMIAAGYYSPCENLDELL